MKIHVAKLPSINIAYRIQGSHNPAIMMLHGFGATSIVWKEQFGVISKKHRLIAPDLRGWGYSEKPMGPHYTIQEHIQDVHSLAQYLGVQKFVLMGSSMGGSIALQYALSYPDSISALVLVGTRSRARTDLEVLISRAINGEHEEIIHDTVRKSLATEDGIKLRLLARVASKASQDAVIYGLEDFLGFNVIKDLHTISVPTLIVFGEHDDIVGLNEAKLIHKKIAGSFFRIVPSAGHLPMFENPKCFNNLLQEFLESKVRDSSGKKAENSRKHI